ncbi:excisionase family protein [Enterobacter hormaechei subsp. steigerwaltii]|nr:excisionase family protein [Enterobacter hormaechei]MCL8186457.1 excisionase family protein [Enterobacter hormaechei]MCM8100159.1 excisionase family protein [Enterobacter hormaechei]MCM8183938.1 excisionase family protein [Enterobacter hormaechei]MCU2485370.1 excisionase family protein [Enterobacter hormaechei subsp. steigerwaltii]
MTLIVPNDWVTQEKLVEITGLRPGTIEAVTCPHD